MSGTKTKSLLIIKEGFHHFGRDFRKGDTLEITEIGDWPEGCFQNRLTHGFMGFTTTLVEAMLEGAGGGQAPSKKSLDEMTKEDLVLYAKDELDTDIDARLSKAAIVEQIKKLEASAA